MFWSPILEPDDTIPPSANEAIIENAATTAAIPAAIAAILAGNGNDAPDAVASEIATP